MAMIISRNNLTSIALSAFDKSVAMIGKALSKVAHGQKIVSASDDASQYAMSQRMRSMIRDLDQSSANIQNDSTMLKVAESSISSTMDIIRSMKEKAIEAADETSTDEERRALQKEFDALIDQVNDNSRVEYNGKHLLDGASSPLYSNNYSREDLIARGLHSEWIQDALNLVEDTYGLGFNSVTSRYKNMDVFIDQTNESPASINVSERKPNTLELHIDASYFDQKYFRNANGVSTQEGGLYLDRHIARAMTEAVLMSNVDNYDSINEDLREGLLSIMDGGDDDNFSLESGYTKMRYMAHKSSVPTEDLIKTFVGYLADGWEVNAAIKNATGGAIKGLDDLNTRVASLTEENMGYEAGIYLDNEDIGSINGSDSGRGGTKNARTAVRETSNPANWRQPSSPSTFINGIEVTWEKQYVVNGSGGGGFSFQIGTNAYDKMNVGLFNMSAYGLGLIDDNGKRLSISSQGDAKDAANFLDHLMVKLGEHLADIGAINQRVTFTSTNLERSSNDIQSAESIIRDADMAKEMVELNRGRALNEASQSVLAQANQNSEKVLQVLSNDSAPIEVHSNTIQAKRTMDDNLSEVGRDLKQLSTGQKIVDPTDGSSPYQIGESMRVKLRALEQSEQNVQNSSAILKTAEGSIETIVSDLNMLKELAVNAASDHNTDVDRRILQKTFDQIRNKINDLASMTTYNGNQLVDGRYQKYHVNFDDTTNRTSIYEAMGLTVQHGTEVGQATRFFINDMHTKSLGGTVVRKEDLDALLTKREFLDSRNDAEIENLTQLQSQLEQLREDTGVLARDENLQARLQGVFERFDGLDTESGEEININHAVMRDYISTTDFGDAVKNMEKYELLKPMLEEALVVDALTTRLDEEGNVIETENVDAEGNPIEVEDLEDVKILQDAAGKTLDDVQINNIHNAGVAMKIVESALNVALGNAADVSAQIARLEYTGQNVSTQITNTEDMNSTIRDADMAKSMSKFARDQMLTQVSQTMLSQAIHNPQMVLSFTQ